MRTSSPVRTGAAPTSAGSPGCIPLWKRPGRPWSGTSSSCSAGGEKVVGSAIINQTQVDVYAQAAWQYPAQDSQVMVLHTLVIDPSESAHGYGGQFAAFYEAYAAQNGCPYLRIDTNARNEVARKFYKKLGYREVGIVPCRFNGLPDVDLVMLEKKIY